LDRWWQQTKHGSYTTPLFLPTSFVSLATFSSSSKWLLCESGDLHRMFGLCSIPASSLLSAFCWMRMSSVRLVDTLEHQLTFFLYFVPYYRHFSSRLHFQNRLKGSNGVAPPPPHGQPHQHNVMMCGWGPTLVSGPVNYHSKNG
jgi:hypothetical protein